MTFWATSCLKDNYTDFSKVGNVIEFMDAIPSGATAISFAPGSTAPDTILIRVNQAGPGATTVDLNITIGGGAAGQVGLTNYNQDTSHVVGTLLPDSSFSFPTSVTIKAGKDALGNANRTGTFPLVIYPSKVPTTSGVNYVLVLAITGVPAGTTASGNFGYILFNFYHNPYDGDYTGIGTRYNFNQTSDYTGWDPSTNMPLASSAVASTGPWNYSSTPIVTVNAKTSTVHVGNSNGGFGTMNITVNPATNVVTIASNSSTAVNGLVPQSGPGAQISTWNPMTKTFSLYYQYTNLDANGNPSTFRVLHEVLTHN
jgi:hypothetical protein